MKIEVIDTHSVATDLLQGDPVLDAGCRGFNFARWFMDREQGVVCVDPALPPRYSAHGWAWNVDTRALVWHVASLRQYYLITNGEPQSWYVSTIPEDRDDTMQIQPVTIQMIMDDKKIKHWDVVKLDIEGSEYDILRFWPGPIANQITVEFHEHTSRKRGETAIAHTVDHLSQWYEPVQHERTDQHCAGMNYWDSLFILKELL